LLPRLTGCIRGTHPLVYCYIAGRNIDLSYGLAKRLSLTKEGIGKVLMTVL
jgi:hypothetical protein